MGRAVPHHGQRLGVFLGDEPQLHFARRRQRTMQIDLFAIDLRQHRRLGEPGPDLGRHVVGRHRPIKLFPTSVGEDHGEHASMNRTED